MDKVRVAAIQMDSAVGQVEENLARARQLVQEAAGQGADLVVLPELFNTGYEYSDRNFARVEPLDGRTGTWIGDTARRLGVHLVGTFPAFVDDEAYITAMLAAPTGARWIYRKVHVAFWENLYFARGPEPVVADTELGRIGLLICWDQVFADQARAYQGRVDLLCIPSSPPIWSGTVEDGTGNVLGYLGRLRALGKTMDGVEWFARAQEAHARCTGVPVVYAARCGAFHSPIPHGWPFLAALRPREALRVLRSVGTRYLLRSVLQGRSAILDATGERIVQAGPDGEVVLVASVQAGAPEPAALPPVPAGRILVPDISWFALLYDDSLAIQGRRYRRRKQLSRVRAAKRPEDPQNTRGNNG
jgi:predicted amidohydrolase